jgi:hypothetical protein
LESGHIIRSDRSNGTALFVIRLSHWQNTQGHAQLATKKINNAKAWTSDEDERLRKLIISNAPAFDIAADLGRTLSAVRARAQALRISLGSSRFRMKAKGK